MKNILVFMGTEKVVIKNKIKRAIAMVGVDEYNLTRYDVEETPLSLALNDCLTAPFLSDKKVVVLLHPTFLTKSAHLDKETQAYFLKFLKDPLPQCLVIFDCSNLELDDRKEEVRLLLQVADTSLTQSLDEKQFFAYILRYFSVKNIAIDRNAVSVIQTLVGSDLENAANELQKLALYCMDKKRVEEEDVYKVIIPEPEHDAFALSQAIISGKTENMIAAYTAQKATGKDDMTLFNMTLNSLKMIYYVSLLEAKGQTKDDIAKTLGISSGRAYYLLRDTHNMAPGRIEELIKTCALMDVQAKNGERDISSSFELFIMAK